MTIEKVMSGRVATMVANSLRHRKKAAHEPRHPGVGNIYRRARDNWSTLVMAGADPRCGSVIALLYLEGVLTETQASAGDLYGRMAGRFDRLNAVPRRNVRSPSWESGFGRDDEVERHRAQGTITEYERQARRARRQWERAQDCVPDDLRRLIDDVCIHDRRVPTSQYDAVAVCLAAIAVEFGVRMRPDERPSKQMRAIKSAKKKFDIVLGAVRSAESFFAIERATPKYFKLLMDAPDGERGICVYAERANSSEMPLDAAWCRHSVLVKCGKTFIEAELDSLLLRAAAEKGWAERAGEA